MSRLRVAESIRCLLNQREAHNVGFSIPRFSDELLHRSYPRASRLHLEARDTDEVPAAVSVSGGGEASMVQPATATVDVRMSPATIVLIIGIASTYVPAFTSRRQRAAAVNKGEGPKRAVGGRRRVRDGCPDRLRRAAARAKRPPRADRRAVLGRKLRSGYALRFRHPPPQAESRPPRTTSPPRPRWRCLAPPLTCAHVRRAHGVPPAWNEFLNFGGPRNSWKRQLAGP